MNCSNHKKDVAGISDMKILAEMIGDLHYKTLASLLNHLSNKLWKDGQKDVEQNRNDLGGRLIDASMGIDQAYGDIEKAYKICEPFMSKTK